MMHHSGPEWLALGIPCISHYDDFTERTWKDCFGCTEMPFVNATMDTLHARVESFLSMDEEEMRGMTMECNAWAAAHLDPSVWIKRYMEFYDAL